MTMNTTAMMIMMMMVMVMMMTMVVMLMMGDLHPWATCTHDDDGGGE